jgi:hypothetical protein
VLSSGGRIAVDLKYAKAAECLAKDRQSLLTFYDFPAEHWPHLALPTQSNRLRHSTVANGENAWLCLARRHPGDGLQVDEECGTEMAQTEGTRSPGPSGPRREV